MRHSNALTLGLMLVIIHYQIYHILNKSQFGNLVDVRFKKFGKSIVLQINLICKNKHLKRSLFSILHNVSLILLITYPNGNQKESVISAQSL